MSELNRNQIDIGFASNIIHRSFRILFEQLSSKDAKPPTVRPIFLHSSPGIGKSAIVKQLVKRLSKELSIEVEMRDFRLASCEASDLCGIPYVSHAGKETEDMRFSTPDWFPRDPKSFGILFLDELSNAPISVQHAAYRLVNDRELHDGVRLPDGWLIVAAGNLKTDKTGVKGIAPALANRFGTHLYIQPSVQAFSDYGNSNGMHSHVLGFLNFKQDALYRAPKDGSEDAYPTPRSWEAVSEYLKGSYGEDELDIILAGCVGKGVATDFIAFRENYGKLPNMEDIMLGKKTYTVKKEDRGLSFALVSSLVSCVIQNFSNKSKLSNLEKLLTQLDDDFLTYFFRSLQITEVEIHVIMEVMEGLLKRVSKRVN